MSIIEYTAMFPFCGLGGGALGFIQAEARLLGRAARIRSLGGFDRDPAACRDFEYLTDSPALCIDVERLAPAELREFFGPRAPHIVFTSAPCKGYSALTNPEIAASPEYQRMNYLGLVGLELIFSTWDEQPRILLFENVPRILSKGKAMLVELRKLLTDAGYLFTESTHDCGELGGGAQHRRRYLCAARQPRRVAAFLHVPAKQRVKACGEELTKLWMPEDPRGGVMHTMSRLSWGTWCTLALIPPGGDARDLPGVLSEETKRRELWRRHHVCDASKPAPTVGGPGSNGPTAIADPRVACFAHTNRITPWDSACGAVTHSPSPTSGQIAVADPRVPRFWNVNRVQSWEEPSLAVIGVPQPGSGALSVADPRIGRHSAGNLRIIPWGESAGTVTGNGRVNGSGAQAVADPRGKLWFDHAYKVAPFGEPIDTISAGGHPGCGTFSVSDPRVTEGASALCESWSGMMGVVPFDEAIGTILGECSIWKGAFALADPRLPKAPPSAIITSAEKSPIVPGPNGRPVKVPVVILARDGTWHRPLTPLELAVLQGLPAVHKGAPLTLDGRARDGWLERVGNAVPSYAARAIAGEMLLTFLASDFCGGLMPSGCLVWVNPATDHPLPFVVGLDGRTLLEAAPVDRQTHSSAAIS